MLRFISKLFGHKLGGSSLPPPRGPLPRRYPQVPRRTTAPDLAKEEWNIVAITGYTGKTATLHVKESRRYDKVELYHIFQEQSADYWCVIGLENDISSQIGIGKLMVAYASTLESNNGSVEFPTTIETNED